MKFYRSQIFLITDCQILRSRTKSSMSQIIVLLTDRQILRSRTKSLRSHIIVLVTDRQILRSQTKLYGQPFHRSHPTPILITNYHHPIVDCTIPSQHHTRSRSNSITVLGHKHCPSPPLHPYHVTTIRQHNTHNNRPNTLLHTASQHLQHHLTTTKIRSNTTILTTATHFCFFSFSISASTYAHRKLHQQPRQEPWRHHSDEHLSLQAPPLMWAPPVYNGVSIVKASMHDSHSGAAAYDNGHFVRGGEGGETRMEEKGRWRWDRKWLGFNVKWGFEYIN